MSTLGVLYTGRAGKDYFNHVGGIDGFLRLDDRNSLTFQFLHSETDYPLAVAQNFGQNESRFGGNAFSAAFQHFSRNWIVAVNYEDRSGGFRADYGFVPRVDTREAMAMVFRQIWGKQGGWFNLIRLGLQGLLTYDHAGTLTDRGLVLGLAYNGQLESLANLHAFFARTFYEGRYFDTVSGNLTLRVRPFSGSEFSFKALAGQDVDYSNVRTVDVLALGPQASLNLGRHFNIGASHNYERLSLAGSAIYTANLTQARLIYNFSVRAFVRAIVQYNDLKRDPDMYLFPVDGRSRRVFTQFLFSYKLNARTVLFLGYSDNSLGGNFEYSLGRDIVDITRINRTFFLKIGYAWQI